MSYPSFRSILTLFIDNGLKLDKMDPNIMASIIRKHRPEISETTIRRRLGTVMAWLKWLKLNIDIT